MQLTLFKAESTANLVELSSTKIPEKLLAAIKDTTVVSHSTGQFSFDPSGKMNGKEYKLFKDFVVGLRGSWSKKEQSHLFDYDPTDAIALVIDKGFFPKINPPSVFPDSLGVSRIHAQSRRSFTRG